MEAVWVTRRLPCRLQKRPPSAASMYQDMVLAEGTDQGLAIGASVIRNEVVIGRDHCSQVVAEQNVHGRAIIHGSNADRKQLSGQLGGLGGQKRKQLGGNLTRRQYPGAATALPLKPSADAGLQLKFRHSQIAPSGPTDTCWAISLQPFVWV